MRMTITYAELATLAEAENQHLVSLYMPTYTGVDSRQNLVRYKNLLRQAADRLRQAGLNNSEAADVLAPARELLDQPTFWDQLAPGLAVLINHGHWTRRLPIECPELCVVGPRFHITPLLECLANDAPYYILTVSQNMVKLFQGTRNQLANVTPVDCPKDLRDALRLEPREPALNATIGRPQVPGKGDLHYHGHGGLPDAAKDELLLYFRVIDRALKKGLQMHDEPLLFAGVDYLFPIYQQANSYPNLLPHAITGNPELLSPDDLQERAWPLMESLVQERREQELAKFWNLVARGRTSNDLQQVLLAAYAGAVETLFLDPAMRHFGQFTPEENSVRINGEGQHDGDDLINLAAVLVVRNKGRVEMLPSGNVPGGGTIAAVFRYPYPPAGETVSTTAQSKSLPNGQ